MEMYDFQAHELHRRQFGQDVAVFTLGGMGMLLTLLGYPDQGLQSARSALEKAVSLKSPFNVCFAKAFLAGTWHYRGDRERTSEVAHSLLNDAELYGIADWPPIARILNGWAQHETEEADREIDNILSIGNRYAGPYWSFTVAQTERALGKFEAAIVRIDRALGQSDELGVLYYIASRASAFLSWRSRKTHRPVRERPAPPSNARLRPLATSGPGFRSCEQRWVWRSYWYARTQTSERARTSLPSQTGLRKASMLPSSSRPGSF
jgi:hypothetical protein